MLRCKELDAFHITVPLYFSTGLSIKMVEKTCCVWYLMNAQVFIFKHIRFFNMYKLKYNLCSSKYIALGSLVFNCQINGYKCGRTSLTPISRATPLVNISKFMKNLLKHGTEICERTHYRKIQIFIYKLRLESRNISFY